ncbi:uncharacterized protein LOC127705798 [Mytilus californianus]|uniref:uncharacterized protein LOC127705798 n=1 Tax=Mytilus californianus TaxID=6549 RepID=UPI0022475F9F|nr:uncharacterized protein LOC127705798 [Mytilus californianus]
MQFILLVFGIILPLVVSHRILTAKKHGGDAVLFILFPEEDVPAEAYKSLGTAIQTFCPLQLWIGIIEDKRGTYYEVTDVLRLVDMINTEVYRLKKTTGKVQIILGGHGQSGSLIQQFVSEYPDVVSGIILLGTHVMSDKILLQLNVPTMTVIGNLDGLTKITTLANVYKKFLQQIKADPSLKYRYPMVVLDGVNHGIFSNGQLPIHLLIQDITLDTEYENLLQYILQPISTFLFYCRGDNGRVVLDSLNDYFVETNKILEPLLKAHQITIDPKEYKSHWVKQSQMWLSDLVGPDSTRINIESYFTYQSAFNPALFNESVSKVTIYLFSQLDTPVEKIDSDEIPLQIHARMFRRDAILKKLGITQNDNSPERTCKDLNYASYVIAYNRSAEKIRKRFDKRNPGILFHEDIIIPSESSSNEKNILATRHNRVLHVTSYAYITENNDAGGHICCTLLPPIRAMEWIYYGIYK